MGPCESTPYAGYLGIGMKEDFELNTPKKSLNPAYLVLVDLSK